MACSMCAVAAVAALLLARGVASQAPGEANIAGVVWKYEKDVRWAYDCDFLGDNLYSRQIPGDQCGPLCFAEQKCTHFVWRSGTCWIKSYPDRMGEAPVGAAGGTCGVVNWNMDNANNVKWLSNCDFHGPVFDAPQMTPAQCGPACNANRRCTHFVHRDGVCYMKSYPDKLNSAAQLDQPNRVCGVVLNWNFDIPNGIKWMSNCDFHGLVFHTPQMTLAECGPACNRNLLCTHFVHRDGVCYMKSYPDNLDSAPALNQPNRVCGVAYNKDANTIEAGRQREILVRYAPRVHLHPDEKFYPSSVDWIFRRSTRFFRNNQWQIWWDKDARGGERNLALNNVYAFWVPVSAGRVHLVYWFFYPYNDGKTAFNVDWHDGDWEHVTIRLDNGSPTCVTYAYHQWSETYKWIDVAKVEGEHIVVYSAQGSHGSWKDEGAHAYLFSAVPIYDYAKKGPNWDTWTHVEAFLWDGAADRRRCLPGNMEFPGPNLPGWLQNGDGGNQFANSGPIAKWGGDDGVSNPINQSPMTNPASECNY